MRISSRGAGASDDEVIAEGAEFACARSRGAWSEAEAASTIHAKRIVGVVFEVVM